MARQRKSPPQLKALQPKTRLYQSVQEEIKAYIIEHSLRSGDSLPPEAELARQLKVGRSSVREAVKSLETLGILESRPGIGLFVQSLTLNSLLNNLGYALLYDPEQLPDFLEIRCHLESGAAETVVQNVTLEQKEYLRAALDQLRVSVEQGAWSSDADRAFHQHIYINTQNDILWKMLNIFWEAVQYAQAYAGMPGPEDPTEAYRIHEAILRAIESADAEKLRRALIRHCNWVGSRLRAFQQARFEQPQSGSTVDEN